MPDHHDAGPGRIEDYALLSDLRTAALVGLDGSVDWLCLPRFDSPSCFARLLGDDNAGRWLLAPTAAVTSVKRRYRDTTLVLETEFETVDGVVRVVDAMPPHADGSADEPRLVRVVEGVSGNVEMRLRWVLRFAYGDSTPWVRRVKADNDEHILAVAGPHAVVLRGDRLPYRVHGQRAHEAVFTVAEGQRLAWTMEFTTTPDSPAAAVDPYQEIARTERFWHDWQARITYQGPHQEAVRRSLATLKALTYAPTGGIIAAPTTSLPEALGGERNWDYRYCWLRDATLTLLAFDSFGCTREALAWRSWLLRAVAGDPADLQIMYAIDGERHLLEWEVDWLPGYHGATPVRVGNAAFRQLQLDVYGEVMDALHLARERGVEESAESWALQRGLLRHLEEIWEQPDKGLWEVRGPDRFFTHSRVMIWVAFDRAVRAVEQDGLPGPVERWRELRDAVHAEVLAKGWNADLGAFTQYYGGTDLDAATLLIPAVGFLPGDDPRVVSTIAAVERTLKHGDLVDRYTTSAGESSVDGLSGHEGSFLACSFWFADALALSGRRQEAEAMFERLAALANDIGLLAEEYDGGAGRFTGNFPQAFSHLALVNSAAVLFGDTACRHEANRR
ncbi:glycoside hydrolase family 15 protein [Kutzneria sp. 744]|uniref:glycoside hydrolase family 15 protein n=1 Tax=Kutzneria sp. (strain 744) TaxID=345341 RepID=UPI0003EEB52E|nr:glycoside hydrolase family 15 protein [Kutzneria sp. 744]EWM15124.1 glucoamylase [Kutzneria sp. 744]